MLYNVNPLTEDGQAGHPHAGLRVGDYKILCCEYHPSSQAATADPEDVGAGTYHVKGVSSSTLGEPSVATGPVAMAVNDTRGDPDFARNSGVMMFNRKQATASHRLDSK